jgi:hypothetical protein
MIAQLIYCLLLVDISHLHTIIYCIAQVQKLNFIAIKTENNSVTFQDSIKNRSKNSFLNL